MVQYLGRRAGPDLADALAGLARLPLGHDI
jgi:hypothetical protein